MSTNPLSHDLFERALKVFPSGVTHDNRYFGNFEPVYFNRAEGSHKWDVDGKEYIDYWMGHGALLMGHGYPAIVEAVDRQMALGTHFGGGHPLGVETVQCPRERHDQQHREAESDHCRGHALTAQRLDE